MRQIAQMSRETAARITTVFANIDDTLTSDGRLPACAYAALEALHDAGFHVAPITGRPAGWCDMIARFWPVSGVVGENGAFYFAYDGKARKMRREYFATPAERSRNQQKLTHIRARILAEIVLAARAA